MVLRCPGRRTLRFAALERDLDETAEREDGWPRRLALRALFGNIVLRERLFVRARRLVLVRLLRFAEARRFPAVDLSPMTREG